MRAAAAPGGAHGHRHRLPVLEVAALVRAARADQHRATVADAKGGGAPYRAPHHYGTREGWREYHEVYLQTSKRIAPCACRRRCAASISPETP
jgi:hypothetical protein